MSKQMMMFKKKLRSLLIPSKLSVDKDKTILRPPEHVEIVVHNYCNFKCKMCKIWEHKNPDKISLQKILKIIDDLSRFKGNNLTLQFIGGETLLYKDLHVAIKHASNYGIKTSVTTNGHLLNESMIKKLSYSGLYNLNISLDSIEQDVHNELRGIKDSYQKIMTAIKLFKSTGSKINLGINSVINALNFSTLIKLSRFVMNEERIGGLYFIALDKPYDSEYKDNWMQKSDVSYLWPSDKKEISKVFDSLIIEKKFNSKIQNSISQLKKYKDYYLNPVEFIKKFGCRFGYTNAYINSVGEMRFCTKRIELDPVGNINNTPVTHLWESKKANSLRNEMAQCKLNCVQILSCAFKDE